MKVCIECRFYSEEPRDKWPDHPYHVCICEQARIVNRVTGESERQSCENARATFFQMNGADNCGPEARYWEPKAAA